MQEPAPHLSRRQVIKLLGAGAVTLYLGGCASVFRKGFSGKAAPRLRPAAGGQNGGPDFGPIDRTLGAQAPARFSGDDPERPHRVLTDFRGYLASKGGTLPPPEERVPLAVVGGGIGGLVAAYQLRAHRPVLLEQATRFGGNSRGESWQGIDYSIGAAYFSAPDEGSALDGLYRELGLDDLWRLKTEEAPGEFQGELYREFWEGATAPGSRRQFQALRRYFREVLDGENGRTYPEIPVTSSEKREGIDELDRLTFRGHVEEVLGGEALHPHISTALEHYCWSSFGASFSEVSAASGLNFYASELGELLVTPGGNAAVAERILDRLAASLPPENLRAGALVFRVKVVPDGVEVVYEDRTGRVRCLHARAVVLACPKFIAAEVLEGIEPERKAAIRRLQYNSYLVGNVLIRKGLPDPFYDLYFLGDGTVDPGDIQASSERQKVTDVVMGTYACPDPERTVLTLYRGLPYAGARSDLYDDAAYERYRREFEEQVSGSILPLLGLRQEDVVDLRLARWGHPMPVARAGLIADRVPDALRAPFRERVFFVQQDNWALPSLECAATEALLWAPEVERLL